jgi:hypothetical protein
MKINKLKNNNKAEKKLIPKYLKGEKFSLMKKKSAKISQNSKFQIVK